MKNIKYCPICAAKKIIHSFTVNGAMPDAVYGNGAALTPPMGWSSWNLFRNKISEELILEIADAMVKSGLKDAGYEYINLDDCWQSSSRDKNGRLQSDRMTFPSGIKGLAERINQIGLKLGIYSSNGTYTCEDLPASLGYEDIDADTFASWGVEYFKYDFCHNKKLPKNAPLIVKLEVGKNGKISQTKYAADAKLSGNARIVKDKDVERGCYIKGLSSYSGEAYFELEDIPSAGEYDLTLTVRKERSLGRFLVIEVEPTETYDIIVPETKAFSSELRLQTSVFLKKGKNTLKLYNPIGSSADSSVYQYTNMGRELKRATCEFAEKNGTEEKPIVYSICEWGRSRPWKWGKTAGNLWRITPDITAHWLSIYSIYKIGLKLGKYSGVGGWNDPDMLEVGNGELTYEENYAHFALWCMLSAPLILGNDVRKFIRPDGTVKTEDKVLQIITNKALISIDQDALGISCRRIESKNGVDILVKPLESARAAVCFFNKTRFEKSVEFEIKKAVNAPHCDLPYSDKYSVRDCRNGEIENTDTIKAKTAPHGVQVYIIEERGSYE